MNYEFELYSREQIESLLFFNDDINRSHKIELKNLFIDVWMQIYRISQEAIIKIYNNLEFVIFKPIQVFRSSPFGGLTKLSSQRCFIIFYPQNFDHKITNRFVLAHELAHVYFGHPYIFINDKQKKEFDLQANEQAINWGFKEVQNK